MPAQTVIKLRRDTAANWTAADSVLAAGELGIETDTNRIKIGDGTTEWTGLKYGPVGDELVIRVKNASNTTAIPAGRLVQFAGAAGDTVTAEPAVTNGSIDFHYLIGVTAAEIAAEGFGNVVITGTVTGLATNSYTAGTLLYADDANPGQLTSTPPSAPSFKEPVAAVTRSGAGTSGQILVRLIIGSSLNDIHDVELGTLTTGQVLQYDGTKWANGTIDLSSKQDVVAGVSSTEIGYLDGVTSAIQTQLDSKLESSDLAGYATETYVGTQIANLVDSAPATLDTLNELAAALGDDANFATTVTNAIAEKAPSNSPTFTGLTDFQGIVDFSDAVVIGIDALPSQTGNAGKLLTTDGTNASWSDINIYSKPSVPSITSPASGSTGLGPTVTFTSSAYTSGIPSTHASTDWQIASDSGFVTIVAQSLADSTNKTSWTSPSLAANTTFYARVQYRNTAGDVSGYSATITLSTKASYFARINGFVWYETGAASPDSYYSLNANGTDGTLLSGNTGYTRQTTGTAVIPYAQAMMRRCVLKNDGTGVVYYLDADDSTKIAGTWSGSVQTGWLRVHEGFNDPVRPIPGQGTSGNAGLRALATAWSSASTYAKGDLVTSGGKLWVSLSDSNTNITPASGTSNATLDGSAGQVMVEVPRFYVYYNYNSTSKRHAYDIIVDPDEVKPFPNLSVALSGATTTRTDNGLTFTVHPAFQKAGVERSHRYYSAYRAYNNGGTAQSRSGVTFTVSQTRETFRTQARAMNPGLSDPSGPADNVYGPIDWHLRSAVNLLMLTEFRSFHHQAILGAGNVSGSDYAKTNGRSNPAGNAMGAFDSSGVLLTPDPASTVDDGVLYRGIEDYWGSSWLFIDGVNFQGTGSAQTVYLSNTPSLFADDTATNYTNFGTITGTSAGYPSAFNGIAFLPQSTTNGSSTTYSTDIWYNNFTSDVWRIAFVGGFAGGVDAASFSLFSFYVSTYSQAVVGGALSR